jgi:HD-GYP domain-containing protein (c-di-GMP phosphodiesterase class II)
MLNQPETKKPNDSGPAGEPKPEKQYDFKYLTRILGDHFVWYITVFSVFLAIFSFAPFFIHLIGLTPAQGWETSYYIALYRVLFILCVMISSWRFGIWSGVAASLILSLVMFLPSILGLRTGSLLLDIAVLFLGFITSWVIGRQGDLQRLLFKTTVELRQQAQQLRLEIAERKKAEQEIKTLSLGAIESLVFALEAKDKYTAGHSRRVKDIAIAIGRKMNLSDADLEDLRYGGMLHDVGKIGVDQLIQNKPGNLTREEYEHIMIHAQAGSGIVKPIVNSKVVELIAHHHDYYGGGSLHQVTTGENIPLGARIIALADAFDAMTSDRPYRLAMPASDAMKEIQTYTGTQFDPAVVKAFLEIPLGEILTILQNKGISHDQNNN